MSYYRLTGPVIAAGDRPWNSKDGRSGVMPTATVRLSDFITTEVVLADDIKTEVHRDFEVDLVVLVEVKGNYERATAVAFWQGVAPVPVQAKKVA